jgi:hypothetical protein
MAGWCLLEFSKQTKRLTKYSLMRLIEYAGLTGADGVYAESILFNEHLEMMQCGE